MSTDLENTKKEGSFQLDQKVVFETRAPTGGLVGSMVGIFFMCLLYEALKFARDHLMRQSFRSEAFSTFPPPSKNSKLFKIPIRFRARFFERHYYYYGKLVGYNSPLANSWIL